MKKLNQRGFSAVEVVVVIVIIGLLGLVGWRVYESQKTKSPTKVTSDGFTSPSPSTVATPAPASAATTIEYKAKIGKFTLKLASSYGIIVNQDSGGEGCEMTSVEVGARTADAPGVIVSSSISTPTIRAYPYAKCFSGVALKDMVAHFHGADQGIATKNVTILGKPAIHADVPGLAGSTEEYLITNDTLFQMINIGKLDSNPILAGITLN